MERRTAIKDLLLIAGAVTFLPACLNSSGKPSIALKNFSITEKQEQLLAEIASTIIPQTDTPGAKELGAHLFVLKMVDDCYEKEDQQNFIKGLLAIDESTRERFKKSFIDCTVAQREQMLQAIENKEVFPAPVYPFYAIMKQRTLQGYLTSKYVLIDIMKYEMVPSVSYNGYYPIKNLGTHGRQS
jgi:hypothetical protein